MDYTRDTPLASAVTAYLGEVATLFVEDIYTDTADAPINIVVRQAAGFELDWVSIVPATGGYDVVLDATFLEAS